VKKGLNPKRERFVAEYLIDLNATQAAIRAGYSPKTAYSQGQRLLKDDEVRCALTKAKTDRADRLDITADRVLQEIAILAFFRPEYVYNTLEGGELQMKTFEEMGQWSGAIAEIKEDRIIKEVLGDKTKPDSTMILNDKRTLKFHDKSGNLKTLCEHLGILKNQVPIIPANVTFRFVYAEPKKDKA
jgi:phage terminase small subunit